MKTDAKINRSAQTLQIVPNKAHLIFDTNQAYQAYSLPKIQYKQQLPELPPRQESDLNQEPYIPKPESHFFKEWNVNYIDDIKKRRQLFKLEKNGENGDYLEQLQQIQKGAPKKKTRLHKTKFRIVKNEQNQAMLEDAICAYIHQHKNGPQAALTKQVLKEDPNAPFLVDQVAFADQLNMDNHIFVQKFGVEPKELRKANLVLEEIVLMRLQKKAKIRQKNKIINQL